MLRRICSFVVLLTLCIAGVGQDGTKSIKSEEYLKTRPESSKTETGLQSSSGRNTKGNQSRSGVRSHIYTADKNFAVGPPPRAHEFVRIGLTIWRFSPGQCAIPNCPPPTGATKGLFDTSAGTRVDDSVALSTGERVRLGLESLSHDGFVYVIDREQFADGTFGDPYLIFPTKSINNGKNYARPGLQVQLPRAEGCFCVKLRDPRRVLVADNLIVIVSPQPLLTPENIGVKEIPLPAQLTSYVGRADKEQSQRATLKEGTGLPQTTTEQMAGTKGWLIRSRC